MDIQADAADSLAAAGILVVEDNPAAAADIPVVEVDNPAAVVGILVVEEDNPVVAGIH